jgi:hypothetical protein
VNYQHKIFSWKVENISEDSLDLIPSPSPSVKIQNWRKRLLDVIRQNIWVLSTKFVDSAQQCFAFTPQAKFPAHNLNFH